MRVAEALPHQRMTMLNKHVYFKDLDKLITDLKLTAKPMNIWNCDETGIQFAHKPRKVVAEKGHRNVTARTSSNRDNITVLACISAAGAAMPPMVIVKGKSPRSLASFNTMDAPKETVWGYQQSGWMEDDLGGQWFEKVFLKHCGPDRPQLLILDSHSSHDVIDLLERAAEENIHILALPPHTTHRLQPLDRSVFGPLKKHYSAICTDYMSQSPDHMVTKACWARLFNLTWDRTMKEELIKQAFVHTGIHPVNPNVLKEEDFLPSSALDRPLQSTEKDLQDVQTNTEVLPIAEEENGDIAMEEEPAQIDWDSFSRPVPCEEEVAHATTQDTCIDIDWDALNSPHTAGPPQLEMNGDLLAQALNLSGIITSDEWITSQETEPQAPTTEISADLAADWNVALTEIFQIPTTSARTQETPTRKISTHRLLTSEEILNSKRDQQALKKQKQQKKKTKTVTSKKNN
ncbi:pogo transposable element with krab domain [Plakobranchus ocellatus]|uniref:Pogo transposable element with krab domain n=1 Tax=Plakobranchus ocellatus TaxID=259542 RepID=A0AAV4BTS9_9GAST|nr:pogo transposable element with krab domain [Plakobranchus ocellatus]